MILSWISYAQEVEFYIFWCVIVSTCLHLFTPRDKPVTMELVLNGMFSIRYSSHKKVKTKIEDGPSASPGPTVGTSMVEILF